jgi:hypothetical protein
MTHSFIVSSGEISGSPHHAVRPVPNSINEPPVFLSLNLKGRTSLHFVAKHMSAPAQSKKTLKSAVRASRNLVIG